MTGPKFCSQCGAGLNEGDIFCSSCGHSIAPAAGPAATDDPSPEGVAPAQPTRPAPTAPPLPPGRPRGSGLGALSSLPVLLGAAAVVLAVAVTVLVVKPWGGEERSPEAYCRAFYEKAAPIRQGYIDAGASADADPLGSLLTVAQVPGDLAVILDGMADVAPDEIRADTEAMRDSMESSIDSAGGSISDPLGALGEGLVNGLAHAGSASRVDAYLEDHCPVDSSLAQSIINP